MKHFHAWIPVFCTLTNPLLDHGVKKCTQKLQEEKRDRKHAEEELDKEEPRRVNQSQQAQIHELERKVQLQETKIKIHELEIKLPESSELLKTQIHEVML